MLSFIIHYWVEILFSLVVTYITYLFKRIYHYVKDIEDLKKAACLNLKMHIIEQYEKIIEKGYLTIDEKEEIFELCKLYKDLNCSNIFLDIYNKLSDMPVK